MTDYSTIKVPTDDFERHNSNRKAQNLTWAAYLDGQAPEAPAGVDLDAVREAAREGSREGVKKELEAVAR